MKDAGFCEPKMLKKNILELHWGECTREYLSFLILFMTETRRWERGYFDVFQIVVYERNHSYGTTFFLFTDKILSNELNSTWTRISHSIKRELTGFRSGSGYIGIERIEGSFYNVMGLPIQKLYETLRKLQFQ